MLLTKNLVIKCRSSVIVRGLRTTTAKKAAEQNTPTALQSAPHQSETNRQRLSTKTPDLPGEPDSTTKGTDTG